MFDGDSRANEFGSFTNRMREREAKEKIAILPNVFFFTGNGDESPLLLGAENINACQYFKIVSVCHRFVVDPTANQKF